MIQKPQNNWWVVQTKSNREFQAVDQLERQGFTTYCPLFKKEIIKGRRVIIKTLPLFPRYIFIQINELIQERIHVIRSTLGVSQILKIGENLIIAPHSMIDSIREMEKDRLLNHENHFKPGDVIKIKGGIYNGLEAVYQITDGLERAVVLINLIQQETKLNISKNQLAKQ